MAFKFVALCSLLAVANAGVISPISYATAPVVAVAHKVAVANPAVDAVASTQQNVVRSFGGTVSSYSKAVDTPYSSVRKSDTRVTNNVYTAAVAKTVAHAAPVVTKTVVAAPAAVYTHAAPVVSKTVYSAAPVVSKTVYSSAPVLSKTVYSAAAPVVATHLAPVAPVVYSHAAPVSASIVAAPAAVVKHHAVAYSPAVAVSHVTFDGFGSHWGF